jgi:hypothetical protein
LAFQLSSNLFFFAVINNSFSERSEYDTFWYVQGKSKNFLEEIRLINCFSTSKSERPFDYCKKSIFNVKINSALGLPQENYFVQMYGYKYDMKRFPIN